MNIMLQEDHAMAHAQILNQNQAEDRPPMAISSYYEQSTSDLSPSRYHRVVNPERVVFRERELMKRPQRHVSLDKEEAFLPLKFCELDLEINAIEMRVLSSYGNGSAASDPDFAAYKLARDQNPAYVNSPRFKISF